MKRDACVPTLGDDTIFSLSLFFSRFVLFSLEVNKLRSRVWFIYLLFFFPGFGVVVTHLSGV